MKYQKRILAGLLATISGSALAQSAPSPVNTIDLSGNYIRIGLSFRGTVGSLGNASPGILYDNTGTGTFNPSYDYLTPGSPFEGFSVKYTDSSGASVLHANNNTGSFGHTNPITGQLYNYSGIAYNGTTVDHRGVWIGGNSAFDIINDVGFNTNQKFVDLATTITAKEVMTNLYFGRYTDPDARAAAGDSSATDNTRGYNVLPGTNVVFSEATVSRYALGLYSAQSGNVNTGISEDWTTDPEDYFNGVNNGNGDNTIGIGFRVPSLNIGDSATFRYAYIFGPSAFAAGDVAINEGAAGGTPGVVPGCSGSCTLTDVGAAADAPSGPTVVSTLPGADIVDVTSTPGTPVVTSSETRGSTSLGSVVDPTIDSARRAMTVTGIWLTPVTTVTETTTPVTITTTTTPTTVTTYSDGSTVTTNGAPTVTTNDDTLFSSLTVNSTDSENRSYSTRVDQMSRMVDAGRRVNATLLSDPLDRHGVVDGTFRPKANLQGSEAQGWFYLIAENQEGNTVDGYGSRTNRFGIGYEKNVRSDWLLGANYNNLNTTLSGDQAGGSMAKNHLGLYSLINLKGWLLKTDLGFAVNEYNNNHSIAAIGLNNNGSTNGYDTWISNRLYTPSIKGLRPYVGVATMNTNYSAFTETGSAVTRVAHSDFGNSRNYADAGVRGEVTIKERVNLIAEAGRASDGLVTAKVGANFAPGTRVLGGVNLIYQGQNDFVNTVVQANFKVMF